MTIASNLSEIRERMARASRRAGRNPAEVALMAVSKTHPASAILEAIAAGQTLFGENRVQEFADKRNELGALAGAAKFHLIGHLQSNKAARAAELFDSIDSVDSLRLAQRLNKEAEQLGRTLDVLIEINIGGEAAKTGFGFDSTAELRVLLRGAAPTPERRHPRTHDRAALHRRPRRRTRLFPPPSRGCATTCAVSVHCGCPSFRWACRTILKSP